jgi:hypothetical protein
MLRAVWRGWRRRAMFVMTRGRGRPVCNNVQDWTERNQQTRARVYFEARRTVRRVPRTVEPELCDEHTIRRIADLRGRYLVQVRGARLVGAERLALLPDGSLRRSLGA